MEGIPQDLVFAVKNIANPDLIKKCEELIDNFKKTNPEVFVRYLNQLLLFPDAIVRGSAAVLIRGTINPNTKEGDAIWVALQPQVKNEIKANIITAINVEQENHIRHKFVNIITTIGPSLLAKNEWPDLLPFIISSVKSENEFIRETSFSIVGSLASDILKSGAQVNTELFRQLVELGLKDKSIHVQTAALGTISSFIDIDNTYAISFKPLLPLMLKTIDNAMQAGGHQEKQARSGIVTLILIVEIKPAWIKDIFTPIYKQLLNYMESDMAEEETRHHCLEFFITVAEKRPSLLKQPVFLDPIVRLMLKWISGIDDQELGAWSEGGDLEEDPTSDAAFGADSLDRFGGYLGKALFNVIVPYLGHLKNSTNWKERHACAVSVSMLSDGCKPLFQKNAKDILVNLIIPLFNDPHPLVRNASFGCAGQMATDLTTALHPLIPDLLPPTLARLKIEEVPRIRSTICIFLSDFLEDATYHSIQTYKDDLFMCLIEQIKCGKIFVQQSALNAFSTVIECVGPEFAPLYTSSMDFLFRILQLPNTKEHRSFRGRAIEAISLIGVAVGKEKFKDDCFKIMEFLSQQPKYESDDPQIDFTLRAYTRFCQCLKEDFVPLLPFAMTPILEAINHEFSVQTQPFADGFVQDIIDENNSRTLENKSLALYLLNVYVSELGHHCYPFLPKIIEKLPQLMKFYYNEDVRSHAADLVPLCLRTIKSHFANLNDTVQGNAQLIEAFTTLFKALLDATKNDEEQIEVIASKVKNIGECLEIIGPIPENFLQETTDTFKEVFTSFKLFEQILIEEQDEDDQDAEESFDTETLNESFTDLAVSIGDFIVANKDKSLPYMQQLLPTIFGHIEESNDDVKTSMICILIDIIANCGPKTIEFYPHIIPVLLRYCSHQSSTIRQNCANGLGSAAEYGKEGFAQYLTPSLQVLNSIVMSSDKTNAENLECTENAITAVGKIVQFQHQHIPELVPSIISSWLKFIPISDPQEFPATLSTYLFLLENYLDRVMGKDCENIPIFLNLIVKGEQLKTAITQDQKRALSNVLKHLYSKQLLTPYLSLFSDKPEEQKILQTYLEFK